MSKTVQGDTPTSEVLTIAADAIRDGRWVTGVGWPGTPDTRPGELCLEGGIMAALGIKYNTSKNDGDLHKLYECPAYKAVQEYLADKRGEDPDGRLWNWNDRAAKNKQDVITVLRATARREKKKEEAL